MSINVNGAASRRGRVLDQAKPLTGRTVIVALGLFFGVMFAADGALIYTALSTLHGEELENPYDASQAYNQKLADSRAQDALGWVANVTTRQEGEGVHVVADFRDRDGAVLPGLQVTARFVHPFDKNADREAALVSDGGAYEGAAPPLHEGKWTLVIEASQGGVRKFTSENKITLGAAGG